MPEPTVSSVRSELISLVAIVDALRNVVTRQAEEIEALKNARAPKQRPLPLPRVREHVYATPEAARANAQRLTKEIPGFVFTAQGLKVIARPRTH